jgi:hypothetical protein
LKILAAPPLHGEVSKTCKKKVGVSVKVVPTLTSRCTEIGLSMAGAKQQWGHEVYPGSGRGPYVQQVCARGAILQDTAVLVEGVTSEVGEEEIPPGPCKVIEAKCQYREWVRTSELLCIRLAPRGYEVASSFYRPRGGGLQACRVSLGTLLRYWRTVLVI